MKWLVIAAVVAVALGLKKAEKTTKRLGICFIILMVYFILTGSIN